MPSRTEPFISPLGTLILTGYPTLRGSPKEETRVRPAVPAARGRPADGLEEDKQSRAFFRSWTALEFEF